MILNFFVYLVSDILIYFVIVLFLRRFYGLKTLVSRLFWVTICFIIIFVLLRLIGLSLKLCLSSTLRYVGEFLVAVAMWVPIYFEGFKKLKEHEILFRESQFLYIASVLGSEAYTKLSFEEKDSIDRDVQSRLSVNKYYLISLWTMLFFPLIGTILARVWNATYWGIILGGFLSFFFIIYVARREVSNIARGILKERGYV